MGFPGGPVVKNPPAIQETQILSLGWKEPLKKEMATHSNILAWEIPWTEEPSGLQSMGPQRVRQDWAAKQKQQYLHIICTYPPIYFKIIFRLLVIPNSSFALLGPSRIFFFFFFFFSIFSLWLVDSMDAESADMEGCICVYEIQLSYLSPVPGVVQLLAGHSRKK